MQHIEEEDKRVDRKTRGKECEDEISSSEEEETGRVTSVPGIKNKEN